MAYFRNYEGIWEYNEDAKEGEQWYSGPNEQPRRLSPDELKRISSISGRVFIAFGNLLTVGLLIFGTYLSIYNYIDKKIQKSENYNLINSLNEKKVRTGLSEDLFIIQSRIDSLKLIDANKNLIDRKINHIENFLRIAPQSITNEECIRKFKRTVDGIVDICKKGEFKTPKQKITF